MSSNKPDFRPLLLRFLGLLALFTLCFFAGRKAAMYTEETISPVASATENWGLGFQTDGERPTANASIEENGNTEKILDALKKHKAPATFFVVGNYLSTSPELINRMVKEGHTVGNHTYHHPDMSQISSKEAFEKELKDVETQYKEITGKEISHFYRPPQGKYNLENLKMAKNLGYHTFFWSLAYVDWYENDQPTKEEAFDKLLSRIHPGAIVLLHNTSKTNGEILDELLTKWEEMGYTFQSLNQLIQGLESFHNFL